MTWKLWKKTTKYHQ